MFPKPLYSLAAALLAAPLVHGHYIFSQLVVNDELVGGDYDYIRKNSNSYQPSFTDDVINSDDLICNQGALSSPAGTYEVKAGDSIGAKLSFGEFIEHPGPGMIYMSKAPSDVASYMGDGDWFKVWESGPDNGPANVDESWGTWQQDRMTFTIPTDIPDGEYLVRFEHVGIHENHVGKSQFYMECAQLSISGGGDGSPSPMVKIPGLYSADDPAFTYSIWDGVDNGYTMPGPAVWSGGGSGGASSSSGASTGASDSGNTTETAPSSGSDASTGSAPSTGSSSTGSSSTGGEMTTPEGTTGGEMTASVPTTGNTQDAGAWGAQTGAQTGGQGSWGAQTAGQGSWGTASTSEKRECDVEYVGGSASRARRAVRA